MNVFRADVVIDRPLSEVWAAFINPSGWAKWYGGELLRVEPGWQAGATVYWKLGAPSHLVAVRDQQSVKFRGSLGGGLKGPETEWVFSAAGGGTRVELVEDYSQADSYVSDAAAQQRGMGETLGRLKKFVEAAGAPLRPQQAAMFIRFRCPDCKKNLRTKEELAGKRIKCPGCGAPVSVPDQDFTDQGEPAPKRTGRGQGSATAELNPAPTKSVPKRSAADYKKRVKPARRATRFFLLILACLFIFPPFHTRSIVYQKLEPSNPINQLVDRHTSVIFVPPDTSSFAVFTYHFERTVLLNDGGGLRYPWSVHWGRLFLEMSAVAGLAVLFARGRRLWFAGAAGVLLLSGAVAFLLQGSPPLTPPFASEVGTYYGFDGQSAPPERPFQKNIKASWDGAKVARLTLLVAQKNQVKELPGFPERDFRAEGKKTLDATVKAIRDGDMARLRQFSDAEVKGKEGGLEISLYLLVDFESQWPKDGQALKMESWGVRLKKPDFFQYDLKMEGTQQPDGTFKGQAAGHVRAGTAGWVHFQEAAFQLRPWRSPSEEEAGPEELQAVRAVEKFFGGVERDTKAAGRPVVAVRLSGAQVTDAALKEVVKELPAFPQLQELRLSYAKVTDAGLKEVAVLPNLRKLVLDHTAVTGSGLKELTFLQELDLSNTKVTDAGLKELAGLQNLRKINLHATGVTDTGVKALAPLRGLQVLWLGSCKGVTGAGLKELAVLPQLQELDVSYSGLTGAGLKELASLKELRKLYLNACPGVADADLKELAPLQQLRELSFARNDGAVGHVTDAGLKELARLGQLQKLDLWGCYGVTDAGLKELASLRQLRTLVLGGTRVTAAGKAELQRALPLLSFGN